MPGPRLMPLSGDIPENVDVYLKKVSKDEFIKNAETDAEFINYVLSDPAEDAGLGDFFVEAFAAASEKRVSKQDIIDRANNPEVMGRYERAHKIHLEQFNERNYLYQQLREKNPVKDPKNPENYMPGALNYGDVRFNRITSSLINTETPDDIQQKAMQGNPLKAIKKLVNDVMKANISDLFTADPDRFLDFASSVNILAFRNLLELDTIVEQTSIYDKSLKNPVNSKHFFPPSSIGLMNAMAKPEDRLTQDEVNFIMQYEPLFTVMSTMSMRLLSYADPREVVLPDDMNVRLTMARCTRQYYKDAPNHKDGVMGVDYMKNYTKFGQNTSYGQYEYHMLNNAYFASNFIKCAMNNEEVAEKGFLNADFTAYKLGENGQYEVIDKMQAIEDFTKNRESVKFELNEYGVRMFPEREAAREKAAKTLADVTEMEDTLKEIYGSKFNASDEFNDLVKSIRELKGIATKESKCYAPNLETLTRKMTGIHEKARTYLITKLDELKGKAPNELRGKRMEFAKKLLKVRGPLQEVKATETLKDLMKKEQVGLRTILNDMEDVNPKINDYKEQIRVRMARIIAIHSIRENVKDQGSKMNKETLDALCNPETIKKAAKEISASEEFKIVYADLVNKTDEEIIEELDDVAASKNGLFCANNGVAKVYNDFLELINVKAEADNKSAKAESVKAEAAKNEEVKAAAPKLP